MYLKYKVPRAEMEVDYGRIYELNYVQTIVNTLNNKLIIYVIFKHDWFAFV